MTELVFCQNCGRRCKGAHDGSNGLHYCSKECEIRDRLMVKYAWEIFLTIFMLFPAMIMTAQYMIDKYSLTTSQEQEETK